MSEGGRFSRMPPGVFRDPTITAGALRVLGAICIHVGPTLKAYASLQKISEGSGIDRRNIPREIAVLERAGYLRKVGWQPNKNGAIRVYEVVYNGDAGCHLPPTDSVIPPDDTTPQILVDPPPEVSSPQMTLEGLSVISPDAPSVISPDAQTAPKKERVPSLRSGGDPPEDAKSILWKEGLRTLMDLTGLPRKGAASQLGALSDISGGDHEKLLGIIREAQVKQPDQVFPWIRATLTSRGPPKPDDPWGIDAWIAKQPDIEDGTVGGVPCKTINGWVVKHYAELIAEAADLPPAWRGNWDCLGRLLRDNCESLDHKPVLEAIRSQKGRMNGSIHSIGVFESAILTASTKCEGRRR